MVLSNLTPRSGKHAPKMFYDDRIVFFGLQYFIEDFLINQWNENFFWRPKEIVVDEYRYLMDTSLGKGAVPVDHIEELHNLGYLPIRIYALPEGTVVPVGVPVLVIRNTIDKFFWLTNYLETILSASLWLPCTSATTAFNYRCLFDQHAHLTGSDPNFVDFQGHDFSFRGMCGLEAAAISGAGHLLSFKGTDTVPAISLLDSYYGSKDLIGASVPATEHSVMSMGGEESEIDTFKRLITEVYPKGIVSIVSDTWDFWKVITEYARELKDIIMARDGKVVFRPDSGDPANIICGDVNSAVIAEQKGAAECLWDIFGGTYTSTGYRVLDPHVGLIYGDSITYERAHDIMFRLMCNKFAASNSVLGIGSYTYQYCTRDTWGWAVKATFGVVNGQEKAIFKKPKTDDGVKNSLRGLVFVYREDGVLKVRDGVSWDEFTNRDNLLKPVFHDSQFVGAHQTLDEIRNRLKESRPQYVQ